MASVNSVHLLGNLGRDVDLKYTQSGQAVCNFSIATTEKWKKDGESHEDTTWHRIVAWGKTAELCSQYLSKGSSVFIEGSIQNRDWEKDGQKRTTTEIKAHTVQFLGGKGEPRKQEAPSNQGGGAPTPDDGIPFAPVDERMS